MFDNRVLRRIFGPKRDEVTGEWRRLHKEELNDLYCSTSVVRVIKSRRRGWTEICPETLTLFVKVNAGGTYTDIEESAVGSYGSLCEGKPTFPCFMTIDRFIPVKNTLA
jgi:hypothetical protein